MAFISRGFKRRGDADAPADRLPPGQYVTRDFPVLSAGPTPRIDLDDWRVEGCCDGCGMVGALGRMRVYPGPAAVFRCPGCDGVVLVVVTIEERTRIHTPGLRWLEPRSD